MLVTPLVVIQIFSKRMLVDWPKCWSDPRYEGHLACLLSGNIAEVRWVKWLAVIKWQVVLGNKVYKQNLSTSNFFFSGRLQKEGSHIPAATNNLCHLLMLGSGQMFLDIIYAPLGNINVGVTTLTPSKGWPPGCLVTYHGFAIPVGICNPSY